MSRTNLLVLSLLTVLYFLNPAVAESPATLSTQGVVSVRGARFTGEGAFRFALVDVDTDAFLWKNDGSSIDNPNPPTNPVILQVVNGVYHVRLGDSSLGKAMSPLPPNVFQSNQELAVRVWFDDLKGGGVHPLTPDVIITTSPYSQYAAVATQLNIPGTSTPAVYVAPNGNVGIATINPDRQLEVNGAIHCNGFESFGPVSGTGFNGWDMDESNDLTDTTQFNGDVTGTAATLVVADDSHEHSDASIDNNISIANGRLFAPSGNGNVGIGTNSPQTRLDVDYFLVTFFYLANQDNSTSDQKSYNCTWALL